MRYISKNITIRTVIFGREICKRCGNTDSLKTIRLRNSSSVNFFASLFFGKKTIKKKQYFENHKVFSNRTWELYLQRLSEPLQQSTVVLRQSCLICFFVKSEFLKEKMKIVENAISRKLKE